MDILISGASTGIGRAAAIQLARKEHSVWAGVRTQKSFDEILRLNVKGLQPVFLDVCIEKSITDCISHIKKKSGILHGLVNNAGMAVGGPIEGVKIEDLRRQFETNVFGQVRVIQECLPLLRESKGRIVNISSIAGKLAMPFLGPYSASKFAFEAVSDSLRRELRPHGVQVSVIEPGAISTPFWEKSKTEGLQRASLFSPMVMEVYGPSLEKFKKQVELAVKTASPVKVVVAAIEHALTSRFPRTRYPVGRGIKAFSILTQALPDRLVDRLIESGR